MEGSLTIKDYACTGRAACSKVNGSALIYSGSCTNLSGAFTVRDNACTTGFGTCAYSYDEILVYSELCDGKEACSHVSRRITVKGSSIKL